MEFLFSNKACYLKKIYKLKIELGENICLKQFGEDKVVEEIVEKKSKFIATMYYVKNEKQAIELIKQVKKQYYDARHNCYAYRVAEENNTIIERQSDDGEPSGTAGGPMLNILSKNNLCNVLVIVTRYFGGILLGTGGLIRAYSSATMEAISSATIVEETLGIRVKFETQYSDFEKLKYCADKNSLKIVDVSYENTIKCYIEMPKELLEIIVKENNLINYNVEGTCIIRK